MALAVGTVVTFTGLPKDHGVLANGGVAVIQGVSFYLGKILYAAKCHPQGAIFHPIDSSNVVVATSPNPPLPLPGVVSGWSAPSHHTATP
jgi:hypothetical protein